MESGLPDFVLDSYLNSHCKVQRPGMLYLLVATYHKRRFSAELKMNLDELHLIIKRIKKWNTLKAGLRKESL